MITNILYIALGMVIGAMFVGFRHVAIPEDSGSHDTQRLDFLDAHQASLLYSINHQQWAVLDPAKDVIGESPILRMAIEVARTRMEAEFAAAETAV